MRVAAFAAFITILFNTTSSWAVAYCGSCTECTTLLAQPEVSVELTGDLRADSTDPSSVCVTIRGRHARLDGAGHSIDGHAQATAVRIEADEVFVHNLGVRNFAHGIELINTRGVSLYHLSFAVSGTAIRVERSADLRIVRGAINGGRVGISFGADPDGRCASATVRSPGAVVENTTIERATVGLSACDAVPVLRGVRAQNNGVGLRLAEPTGAGRAFDRCVCSPGLSGVRAGTTLLFSSGCGGCQVHEGWLPTVRAQGADIRLRETGAGHQAAEARFDRYMEHCAPAVIDALGIPGCVPNYACPANGTVAKVRADARTVTVEHPLDSPEQVVAFARECTAAGRAASSGGRCITHAITDTVVCNNRDTDIDLASAHSRWTGSNNSCSRVSGNRSQPLGCSRPCNLSPETVTEAPSLTHELSPAVPPPPPPSLLPTTAPPPTASHDNQIAAQTSGETPAGAPRPTGNGLSLAYALAAFGIVAALVRWAARSKP